MAFQCIIPISLASGECPVEQLSGSNIINVVYILYFVPKSGIIYLKIKGFMMFFNSSVLFNQFCSSTILDGNCPFIELVN